MYHPIKAANIIYSCCVVHNMAKEANLEDEEIEWPEFNPEINGKYKNNL